METPFRCFIVRDDQFNDKVVMENRKIELYWIKWKTKQYHYIVRELILKRNNPDNDIWSVEIIVIIISWENVRMQIILFYL